MTLKAIGPRFHFIATGALSAALVPALFLAGLPLRFNWLALFQMYWVGFAFQAIFAAAILYMIGFPAKETLQPLLVRYSHDAHRLMLLIVFGFLLFLSSKLLGTLPVFPIVLVVCVALLELWERNSSHLRSLSNSLFSVFLAALYLFLGLVLVAAYNDMVLAYRPYVSYDAFFNRVDSWILMGNTVPGFAHHALKVLPLWGSKILEFVYYYCMFPQIGAALILIAFTRGRTQVLRFAGTLLTAYYLSLALFWALPSQGPFFLCARHFVDFPNHLETNLIQAQFLAQANSLWSGHRLPAIGLDYYIAFPSMHVAAPLIVARYLRHWRKMFLFLLAIDLLILVSIVVLEWHYVIDLFGGVLVALASVLFFEPISGRVVPGWAVLAENGAVTKTDFLGEASVHKG